ncbi:g5432 [Coccomyxa elongata]
MRLSVGTWNVEALNSERKQHEIGFQGNGRVMVLGDLNARVGFATASFDVIENLQHDRWKAARTRVKVHVRQQKRQL